jgi:hypothetical protein
MFAQTDGPTALRSEWVRALSLSVGTAVLRRDGESRRACAALSGVWNGRKGYVALLVRWIEEPCLERFAYAEPLLTLESTLDAVEEGLGFAEGMGLAMDPAEFLELTPELQRRRLGIWDEVRKLDCVPSLVRAPLRPSASRRRSVLARISVVSRSRAGPEARLRAQF